MGNLAWIIVTIVIGTILLCVCPPVSPLSAVILYFLVRDVNHTDLANRNSQYPRY